MTSSIRVLTTSGLDSNPSLLLVSPNGSKTLINCGEGCQRAFLESSTLAPNINVGALRISSVNRVCLTHTGHDAFGGLPGMILTTADVAENSTKNLQNSESSRSSTGNESQQYNKPNLKRSGSLVSDDGNSDGMPDLEIVGPVGTKTFLHSLRHFMRRDRFTIHVHEGKFDSSSCKSSTIGDTVPKKRAKRKKSNPSSNDDIGFTVKSIPIDYIIQDQFNESIKLVKQAVSYVFTTPPIPGKFLIEKAIELKIPKGPMYAELKAGKSVTFTDPETNDKRTVTPNEVLAESDGGIKVIVLYCPSLEVLNGLQKSDMLLSIRNDTTTITIVHLTPKHMFETNSYQSWCKSFGKGLDHIVLHVADSLHERVATGKNSPFLSAMRGAVRRSLINDKVFPMPKFVIDDSNTTTFKESVSDSEPLRLIMGCPMMEYILLPRSRHGVNELTTKPIYTEDDLSSLKTEVSQSSAIDLGVKIAMSISNGTIDTGNPIDETNDCGELIMTGTGSAVPCKHRNVTGMYLRMSNGNGFLLDIGEGTIGLLLQSWNSLLGPNEVLIEEYISRIKGIKAVWISHPHADHHLGLLRLLSERATLCDKNDSIVIIAPPNMFAFLSEYETVVPEIKERYIAVDSRNIKEGFQTDHPIGKRLFHDFGITQCMSIPVAHCPNAFAIVLDGTSFGKVAYSGDCRPSNRFAAAGRGADLLIHEATFEDGMEEEAVLKRHSTVGEAIDIAVAMEAKSLILTHFSQRYPKIPPLNLDRRDQTTVRGMPIVIAFDLMRLRKQSIVLASRLTPALRLLYPNEGNTNDSGMLVDDEAENSTAAKLLLVPGLFATKGIL
jgi:ribonuclease Z